ncbi:MAG: hypothetical protein QG622_1666 [Actinomycetota bacterium]|nr:hypothetical protein [Actinomycetota bacterium]
MTALNATGPHPGAAGSPPPDPSGPCPGIPLDAGHHPSHLGLIGQVPSYFSGPRSRLSGVMVPTHRGALVGSGLSLAAQCAEATDAQLVVLRSGAASTETFPRFLSPRTSRPVAVIDLPDRLPGLFPECRTRHHRVDTLHRGSDLGFKRNLGLVLGVMCGFETVLMLDDDISTTPASRGLLHSVMEPVVPSLRLDDVGADFAACPDLRVVGYVVEDFDDNSVVCHLRRLLGRPQESFIGGGAMVVRPGPDLPFFPSTYNEDWLFFFSLMLEGRSVRPSSAVKGVGSLHQQPFNPYSASRARAEELGDILAEGLFSLLGSRREEVLRLATSPDYWRERVWQRQTMLFSLGSELRWRQPSFSSGLYVDADEALRASLAVIGSVADAAGELARYMRDFVLDLEDWHTLLEKVSPASTGDALSLEEAVSVLGLGRCVTVEQVRGR